MVGFTRTGRPRWRCSSESARVVLAALGLERRTPHCRDAGDITRWGGVQWGITEWERPDNCGEAGLLGAWGIVERY